ncbi:MAG: hypothetical protein EON52_00945 [Actinomycetales bacterium]|nr:MAG: hypothetical protein EON52_00945 [Actinomycetales bacterium]
MHSRRVADLLRGGTSAQQLRSAGIERRAHGLYRPSSTTLPPDLERLDDALGLMVPGTVLGGWASLRFQGNDYFDGWSSRGVRKAFVHCPPGTQLRRREMVQTFRGLIYPDEILELDGTLVSTMARAAFDEARMAPSLEEATVVIDTAVSRVHGRPHTTMGAVGRVLDSHHKVRGIVQARAAWLLASPRVASPWETRTRFRAVDAGVTGLLVNVPIFGPTGDLLGVVDLFDPRSGLVVESDGGHHRELERHTEDNRREERLENHGCVVARLTVLDHRDRWGCVARLRAAHLQALARPRGTWTLETPPWWNTWEPGRPYR